MSRPELQSERKSAYSIQIEEHHHIFALLFVNPHLRLDSAYPTATKRSPSTISTVRPRLEAARYAAAVLVRGACSQVVRVH